MQRSVPRGPQGGSIADRNAPRAAFEFLGGKYDAASIAANWVSSTRAASAAESGPGGQPIRRKLAAVVCLNEAATNHSGRGNDAAVLACSAWGMWTLL